MSEPTKQDVCRCGHSREDHADEDGGYRWPCSICPQGAPCLKFEDVHAEASEPTKQDSPVWAVAYTCTVTAPIGAIYPGETHFTIEKQTRDWMAESWVASRRGAEHGK